MMILFGDFRQIILFLSIMEFRSRGKMKIINGDEVEAAEAKIELGKEAIKKIKEFNRINNQYSKDYEGFFTDLLEGKAKISRELSEILKRSMASIYRKVTENKLSSLLSDLTSSLLTTKFPMHAIVNGIPEVVMVPYDILAKAIRDYEKKFTISGKHYNEMIEIATCDALKYYTLESSIPEFGNRMRKRFRESMDRAGGMHVPSESDQPGFKLTPLDQKRTK